MRGSGGWALFSLPRRGIPLAGGFACVLGVRIVSVVVFGFPPQFYL